MVERSKGALSQNTGTAVALYGVDVYVGMRQHNFLQHRKKKNFDDEKYVKQMNYNIEKLIVSLVSGFISLLETVVVLYFALPGTWWQWSSAVLQYFGMDANENETVCSLVFLLMTGGVSLLISIPMSYYDTFVLEEKYGFNKQTIKSWLNDMVLDFGLTTIAVILIVPIISWIFRMSGDMWYIYVWVSMAVFCVFLMMIYPSFIAPLFNKFEQLPEGPLRDELNVLAQNVSFPMKSLQVMDGSKRSTHSNAYFYGFFGSKHIVLYDNLVDQLKPKEVAAVVAHEMGHWWHGHTTVNLVIVQVMMLAFLYCCNLLMFDNDVYHTFGYNFQGLPPLVIVINTLTVLFETPMLIINLVMKFWSRRCEFQADAFSAKLGLPLSDALRNIHNSNYAPEEFDPIYSMYANTHPTLVERLDQLRKSE